MTRMTRRAFGAAAASAALAVAARPARAAEPLLLRCSLDTAPTHGRNISLADYLGKLEAASNGRIRTKLYSSGSLFPDLHVAKALLEGQVEMAVPGHWVLTGVVPDCDMFQLPAFYGQKIEVTHRAIDGSAGALVAKKLQAKLRTQVLGKWLDLGYQNLYATKTPLHEIGDIKGLKIRSPGGAGISWRIAFWGGIPNTTAWPNVPLALSQGTFDGFVSTDDSCTSAKLWDSGVRHSLADHSFIGEYIPMVSHAFWNRLTPDLRKIMVDLWEANIDTYRANMMRAQVKARGTMHAHGVSFVDPTEAQTVAARRKMMDAQASLIKAAHLSPEIVRLVAADLGNAT